MSERARKERGKHRRVFLFTDRPEEHGESSAVLEAHGYTVRTAVDPASVSGGALALNPSAIIVDNTQPVHVTGAVDALHRLAGEGRLSCPAIFVGDTENVRLRLDALRAGGAAFVERPLDPYALLDTLDRLCNPVDEEPFRVLIVDDSRTDALRHARILEQTGMRVLRHADPLTLVQPMRLFAPELILLDLHMPGCTGTELAAVIRQDPDLDDVPIVFLSGEQDIRQQLAAIEAGHGDDFLTKPIQPEHLRIAIRSRAARFRALRERLFHDPLTGLLNHTSMRARIETAFEAATSRGEELSLALLDIDHFKQVNDRYGHPVGDNVIKSLARLLRHQLRRVDVAGRVGGEEFAVLTSAPVPGAAQLLERLRERFQLLSHRGADGGFVATFSAGLAAAAKANGPSALVEKADQALYEAKRSGRNRLVVSD